MLDVSVDFKTAMKNEVKELQGFVTSDDYNITSENDLIEFKISVDSNLASTAMRKIEIKTYGEYNLLDQWVEIGYGVKLDDDSYEFTSYGNFLITEMTNIKDEDTTSYIGYDTMILSMKPYEKLNITYPINLYDYATAICNAFNCEIYNNSFTVHNNWNITQELWENISDITYRDILQQIAQVTCTTVIIKDDKIYFKPITSTNETLTYDNMFNLKLESKYGDVNSVVLSRTPQEDNIYMQDTSSIDTNGLCEWKIENNQIIDKDRDNAITPIYNAMLGLNYYPFETTTEGLGWYEIGDNIDIVNNEGDTFNTTIFNIDITFDGGIKEVLKTVAPTITQTQYQYASTISKRLKNTEIIVNKQDQYIKQLVTDVYDENGTISENFTQVYQDINNIINSVQKTGGSNLLKNSVMFAYDNTGTPDNWTVTGNGTLLIQSSPEAIQKGGISGHVFTLNNKTVKQRVKVKQYLNDTDKTYYSFSCKASKGLVGTAYVKISNSNEEYTININNDSVYTEYSLQGLLPKDNYYDIEFYGSSDSDVIFTDNMFNIGEYKQEWTQADGELMNTQVNISENGVLVKSSIYNGDYTIMSPLEFAGYSNINGTITKIFSLNKDTTITKKLKCEDQISMTPIKIVPISSGDLLGWAFVGIDN